MVRGRTAATTAAADVAIAQLWNPHASMRLMIWEMWLCANVAPAASAGFYIRRTTARGTAGSTVTPAAVNDTEGALATVSGALLDLAAFTVQPTFAALPAMGAWTIGAASGSGVMIPFPRGIEVPAGAGLALATTQAVAITVSDVVFVFQE